MNKKGRERRESDTKEKRREGLGSIYIGCVKMSKRGKNEAERDEQN